MERAFDRISDLQQKENSLRDEVSQAQIQSEKQLSEDFSKKEDDMKKSKMHLENSNFVSFICKIVMAMDLFESTVV